MKTLVVPPFKALDACHQQIQAHLDALNDLMQRLQTDSSSAHLRQRAHDIEAFFSATARDHHAEEDRSVFPRLLQSDDAALIQAVERLRQDHGWIEQNWIELAPMLRAVAQGEDWVEPTELQHAIEVFAALCQDHIRIEEEQVYPAAKARAAADAAAQAQRLGQA